MPNRFPIAPSAGFTLIEALVVMVITSIIATTIAVFIKLPMTGYVATARRAVLTDVADTVVRRIARDIRLALPNSVRNAYDPATSTQYTQCLEFMPTKIGGRYRAVADSTNSNSGNILSFTGVNNNFDMLWPYNSSSSAIATIPPVYNIAAGDIVVIYNDGSVNGNAYMGVNAIQVSNVQAATAPNSTTVTFVATTAAGPFYNKQLPSASPENQFHVIPAQTHVISYYCSGNTLYRYTRTLTAAWSQPTSCANMTNGATAAVLATNVSTCALQYDQPGSSTGLSRFGIVSISLGITQSGESVSLYDEVHVDNTP